MNDATIVWFGNDLRLEDQPALAAAIDRGGPIVPVYVWAPQDEGRWPPGGASRWWLHESLVALHARLRKAGSQLVIRRGAAAEVLPGLAREVGAGAVCWNRRYEPAARDRDREVTARLERAGIAACLSNGCLLLDPEQTANKQGRPYQVFTPFWKNGLADTAIPEPRPAPKRVPAPTRWPESDSIDDLGLKPRVDWPAGLEASWKPGERGARENLGMFLVEAFAMYPEGRDRPDLAGTSRLSPHLHFGEVGPRSLWHAVKEHAAANDREGLFKAEEAYLRQLAWREFAHHLMAHHPHTTEEPLRGEFAQFPWRDDPVALGAWQRGETGYPFIDAGMRQLWTTGWMHNRVRMAAASFLTKHLLIPWQQGARWFWDTLVDADLANNTFGWQWTAGSGADAAPYFRIFNPVLQGQKFDSAGAYVRRWVPEVAELPDAWIHCPWAAPDEVLSNAGVVLGDTYPAPIVDHAEARDRALTAYGQIRRR